jgi:hypothetical protein
MVEDTKKATKNYFIGWDVGTWKCTNGNKKSCDAIVILDDRKILGHCRENISESIASAHSLKERKSYSLMIDWFRKCKTGIIPSESDAFYIAIDTPLGWPRGFRSLLEGQLANDWSFQLQEPDLKNKLLFRHTEQTLNSGFSVVTHSIGNQSTKGMVLLRALNSTQIGWGVWKEGNTTLLETYPKACLRSKSFVEWILTHDNTYDLREWSNAGSKKRRKPWLKEQDDTFDAGICAYLAKAFHSSNPELVQPAQIQDAPISEGWIFYPRGELVNSNLADGHADKTNSVLANTFAEALVAFQKHVLANEALGRRQEDIADE